MGVGKGRFIGREALGEHGRRVAVMDGEGRTGFRATNGERGEAAGEDVMRIEGEARVALGSGMTRRERRRRRSSEDAMASGAAAVGRRSGARARIADGTGADDGRGSWS